MNQKPVIALLILFSITVFPKISIAQTDSESYSPIIFDSIEKEEFRNTLVHKGPLKYGTDEKGNRIPDFSYAGYKASVNAIPDVPVKITVPLINGDATDEIQNALDYVSGLPLDKNGFRGAVYLEKGRYNINGSIVINTSGVVLRGSGPDSLGTVLVGKGVDRETLIKIAGVDDRIIHKPYELEDQYFPVNSTELLIKGEHSFKPGDHVIVSRPSTDEWLEEIGADKIGGYVTYSLTKWEPGDFDINWDRTITEVSSNSITVDVPLTNSLDPEYGGGSVASYDWKGRIRNAGVENLRCESEFDPSNQKDENHRWIAITIDNAIDSWVRRVEVKYFVSSAVMVLEGAKRITVEDCKSLSPVGEIGNFRRYSFHTLGQQTLFQRCYSEYAYHAFSVGFTVPGPNAFVQCYSYMPYNFSGAIGGWATGILFDKVTIDGGDISFAYRDVDAQGGGWSAANSLCWQCRAARIYLASPPTAENWAYGMWAQGYGKGYFGFPVTYLEPESFFYAQLADRNKNRPVEEEKILVYETDETTAPLPEEAAKYSKRSEYPDLIMDKWIDSMINKYPIRASRSNSIEYHDGLVPENTEKIQSSPHYSVSHGKLLHGEKLVPGKIIRTALWRGNTRPKGIEDANPHITRFVPGRTGRGLTDNLDTLAEDMVDNGIVAIQHFPALWYERRRDDHARTRRANADVWTPFYEQPFSRSGEGEAYDRLSKYDLNKWNTWYWLRLDKFAELADKKGLLLIHEHYLQHNIIEEGAHWVDYPWRSANNINDLGFPEPPHYAGDKRVYMADEFYDISNKSRKKFHTKYIRKSLENFKNDTNVIHHLGIEYTGPVHFARFWLEVIKEWQQENNQDVMVMLPGTKDVQDAILSDPQVADVVDIIDIRQWQYRDDSSLYAPEGGLSLAQRQYARIYNVGESSFGQIYRAVKEYKSKYPEKAVVYSRRGPEYSGWAVMMANGSFPRIPDIEDELFWQTAANTSGFTAENQGSLQYVLENTDKGFIVFSHSADISTEFCDPGASYKLKWINPTTGEVVEHSGSVKCNKDNVITSPFDDASVAFLYK